MSSTVPARGRRHSIRTVTRAREFAAAGWNPADVRRLLIRDGYVDDVGVETVQRWVGEHAEKAWRQRVEQRMAQRATERGEKPMGVRASRPEYRMARARVLKGLGMSPAAIAKVMTFDFEQPVTEDQVRYALNVTGIWPSRLPEKAA
jgi:hypothetical protein